MTIKRCYPVLVGASVAENQLSNPSALPPSGTVNGIEMTNNGDGTITANGTATASVSYQLAGTFKAVVGHKYYLRGCPTGGSNSTYSMNTSGGVDVGNGIIKVYNAESQYIWIAIQPGVTVNNITYRPNFIDLTAYFGSTIADYLYSLETATAGAGIAKLKEWGFFAGEYIPYNPGSLESVEARSHVMRGFNQWDEEWEVGGINGTTGQKTTRNDVIRSKNFIPVVSGADYFIKQYGVCVCYDSDKNFIGNVSYTTVPTVGYILHIPQNASYIMFSETIAYGTTYNHDICISLSSDRNGEYEPYKSITYSLGSDTLRGIFKLDANNNLYADGDVKTSDGTITRRYGIVDLGTLDWINAGSNKMFYANALNADIGGARAIRKAVSQTEVFSWGIDSRTLTKRSYNSIGTSTPNSICISTAGNILATLDTDTGYENATTFKTAMNGVMLVYELATPITERSTPFISPQIVYPDGTEEFVTETSVPVGHETSYQL